MEWIMGKKNPWSYVPLNEEAEQCSEGRASDWVKQWWMRMQYERSQVTLNRRRRSGSRQRYFSWE